MRFRPVFALSAFAATLTLPGATQAPASASTAPAGQAQTAVALNPALLPDSFGTWQASPGGTAAQPGFLADANKTALEEASPERSVQKFYTAAAGRTAGVTAIEFKDASGALAAFSMLVQPDMHEVKGLGTRAAEGQNAVLFTSGAALAVVSPASAADVAALKQLDLVMPKPVGSKALQPLLPTLLPQRGLQPASLRYALGEHSYMAEGGVLPAAGLGWDKDAEAVTAKYNDRRGAETLTMLLYPTPTIAGPHLRAIESELAGLGPSFRNAKTRREGSLVIVADGTFAPDAAQNLVENAHLHQFASTDKAMVTPEVVETRKTFGLLADVIVFSGVLGLAAIVLGLFLGGGRALVRVLRGKPAATEAEFLSLHLAPQNPTPVFGASEGSEGV